MNAVKQRKGVKGLFYCHPLVIGTNRSLSCYRSLVALKYALYCFYCVFLLLFCCRYDYLEFTDARGGKVRYDMKVGTEKWPKVRKPFIGVF